MRVRVYEFLHTLIYCTGMVSQNITKYVTTLITTLKHYVALTCVYFFGEPLLSSLVNKHILLLLSSLLSPLFSLLLSSTVLALHMTPAQNDAYDYDYD